MLYDSHSGDIMQNGCWAAIWKSLSKFCIKQVTLLIQCHSTLSNISGLDNLKEKAIYNRN